MAEEDELLGKVKENPKDTKALYGLAVYYAKAENYAKAEEYFKAIVELEPALFDAHNGLGFALQKQKKYVDAIYAYRDGLKLDKTKVVFKDTLTKLKIGCYKNLAVCHLNINEPQHTITCYRIIAKLDSSLEKEMQTNIETVVKLKSLAKGSEVVLY